MRLRATVAELDRRGRRVRWRSYRGRMCFEVSSNHGTPIQIGGSTTDNGKVPLVIPRGY